MDLKFWKKLKIEKKEFSFMYTWEWFCQNSSRNLSFLRTYETRVLLFSKWVNFSADETVHCILHEWCRAYGARFDESEDVQTRQRHEPVRISQHLFIPFLPVCWTDSLPDEPATHMVSFFLRTNQGRIVIYARSRTWDYKIISSDDTWLSGYQKWGITYDF